MKSLAEHYLRANFDACWCPGSVIGSSGSPNENGNGKGAKKRKVVSLVGSMLAMDVDKEEEEFFEEEEEEEGKLGNESDTTLTKFGGFNWESLSEVDRYLQLPQLPSVNEDGSDVDILAWWKGHQNSFPHLSKMARQYLALPCSSSGE